MNKDEILWHEWQGQLQERINNVRKAVTSLNVAGNCIEKSKVEQLIEIRDNLSSIIDVQLNKT